jgi:hypothetical protein
MSVLDQFRSAEQRVAERLRELKPLVEEYRELEQVAQRLGLDIDEDSTAPARQRPASPRRSHERRRSANAKPRSGTSTREERGGAAAAKRPAATTPVGGAPASRRSGDGGRPGSNRASRRREDVLRLVNERPGITVSQIANVLGVDPTGLYRPVRKLEQDGAISKRGAALQPAGR